MRLDLVWKGMMMGIAEVIPGVSGGTIAFITGIYEELINTIKKIDASFFKSVLKLKLSNALNYINAEFLIPLLGGMIGGIVIGIFGVSYLLEKSPEPLWGFFFGLILFSIPLIWKQIRDSNTRLYFIAALGAIIAFLITQIPASTGSTDMIYVFIGGTIAICALILPGVSGSFMLLLMGLYSTIIPTLKSFLSTPNLDDFKLIFVFAIGCIFGLLAFSRVVSAAFSKYHDGTIALLSGFMLGSLPKVWPWRNPTRILDKSTYESLDVAFLNQLPEEYKIITETATLPSQYMGTDARVLLVVVTFTLSGLLIYYFSKTNTIHE